MTCLLMRELSLDLILRVWDTYARFKAHTHSPVSLTHTLRLLRF